MTGERRPWRWWQKALAYLVMALLAAGAIWLVDRRVPRIGPPVLPETDHPVGRSAQDGRTS